VWPLPACLHSAVSGADVSSVSDLEGSFSGPDPDPALKIILDPDPHPDAIFLTSNYLLTGHFPFPANTYIVIKCK
jgi:hypothetical protein